MSVKTTVVQVGINPTRLDVQGDQDNKSGQTVMVQPDSDIRVGGPDVTMIGVTRGILVPAGYALEFRLEGTSDKLYGVCAAGAVSTTVLQAGV